MTVKEVFERAILFANEKRNNWINIINIAELRHCYITNGAVSDNSFTLFLGDAETISLIRPISNQVGINVDSNFFIYADSIKVVNMNLRTEFIITRDGIKDDTNRIY